MQKALQHVLQRKNDTKRGKVPPYGNELSFGGHSFIAGFVQLKLRPTGVRRQADLVAHALVDFGGDSGIFGKEGLGVFPSLSQTEIAV
ncbi:MAG: hypothetical protein KDD92_18810, partial [Caldilineaceae bacterium]|nr:hypothetical protein [Caldilineaceae bacterium]